MSEARSKSAKNFQVTVNNEAIDVVLSYLRKLKPNYLVACKEKAPSSGHVHYHAYAQYPNCRRLSLKKLEGAHLEVCRGSPEQNEAYIKKDGEIICEEGELRRCSKWSIKGFKEMSKDEREDLPPQMYNIVKKLNDAENKKMKGTEYYKGKINVYWYWGESGSGKTRHAVEQIGERDFNEVKYDGNFWHGVTEDTDIALYDDWRDGHMKPTELINFIDYNRHVMNVKGGSIRNNYKEIYITTLQDPEKIYANVPEETRKQWLRRIKEIIHFEIVNN